MNPILLKPSSDTGSQIIVRGKPRANMRARQYYTEKTALFDEVKACYDSLATDADVVVLEGAGSPGEVNLKAHDIVNMRMAAYAGAPVLIVGDIDRGGVFASFVGTMEVLSEAERALVAGFLVNKFRGDASLLTPALDYTLEHTGRRVYGVVHWLPSLGLPEEDSVSFKERLLRSGEKRNDRVTVAAVDLPHISNFTDLDALRIEPDVQVTVIRTPDEIRDDVDVVVLPGSKNVIGDLEHLGRTGMAARVRQLARTGAVEVVGLCGGFQMLGMLIRDPGGLESATPELEGLGLLPLSTVLAPEKVLTKAAARHVQTGLALHGYEIHHGVTRASGVAPVVQRDDGEILGYRHPSLPVWGTYLHGVFDADEFRRRWIDDVRRRKGLAPLVALQARYDLEPAFDGLASAVRDSVDLAGIYAAIGL